MNYPKFFQKPFLCLFISLFTFSAKSYNIQIKLHGLNHVSVMLAEFYVDSYFIIDTAKTDQNGFGIFTSGHDIDPGIYYVVLPGQKSIEFLLSKNQDIVIETNTTEPMNNLRIYGNNESSEYARYQQFLLQQYKLMDKLTIDMRNNREDINTMYSAMKKISSIEKNIEARKSEIIAINPNWLLSKYLIMSKNNLENRDLETLSMEAKLADYFSFYDFSSTDILRTPLFKDGLVYFMNRYLQSDTHDVFTMTDFIISQSAPKRVTEGTLNIMFLHFSGYDDRLKGEKCLISMAKRLKNESGLNTRFYVERLIAIERTMPGNTIPAEIATYLSAKDKQVLAVWNADCEACKNDKQDIQNLSMPVRVMFIGNIDRGKEQMDEVDGFHFEHQSILLSEFPINNTPVYFLLDETGKIKFKTYNLKEWLYN